MPTPTSHSQILRSSSIIGGAMMIRIALGLLSTKAAALLLGPAGIGLIGLLNQLIATATSMVVMGLPSAGTQQIAKAQGRNDHTAVATMRRALSWGTLLLAFLGTIAVWALRVPIAAHVLGDPKQAGTVGWLALGVGLTVACAYHTALLTGLRRMGDLAKVNIYAAALSTLLGVAALWAWGERGMPIYVLAVPLAIFAVGQLYATRVPTINQKSVPMSQLAMQWRSLARLGVPLMGASLLLNLGHLIVRSLLQHDLGAEALGQFQAAWTLSMTYVGFVLGAMATDYYPRLSAGFHDREATNRMVNEQTEMAILLVAPMLLAMLALAPSVVRFLYSAQFAEAGMILRWQIVGDVFKVAGWPLGFVLLAAGAGRAFLISECVTISLFVLLIWLGLPFVGVHVTGIAFALMYSAYLPLVYWLARRRTGFTWQPKVRRQLTLLWLIALATCLLAQWREWPAAVLGLTGAFAFGVHAVKRLASILKEDDECLDCLAAARILTKFKVWK